MKSLVKQLSVHWDLWLGPYRAFFPTRLEDQQTCRSLVEASLGAAAPTALGDEAGSAPEGAARWAACEENAGGAVIGCLRLHDAAAVPSVSDAFPLVDPAQLDRLVMVTQLALHPAHRKAAAVNVLLSHCFIEVLKAGGQGMLLSCAVDDFSSFRHLGLRPVSPPYKAADGTLRTPLLFIPDQDYLSIINSPVLPLLRGVHFQDYEPICRWYYQLVRQNKELQTGSGFYPGTGEELEGHHLLTEDLSEAGRATLLQNAMVIRCRPGEVLIAENDTGTAFGFVRQGMVKVVIGGKTVVHLGRGDIFGEIAYILHSKRTAQVVAAAPETEVVLFREAALTELQRESDRTVIWRNLARVLAQRVILTNKLLD